MGRPGGGIGGAGGGVVRSASGNRGNEWCFFVQYVLGCVLLLVFSCDVLTKATTSNWPTEITNSAPATLINVSESQQHFSGTGPLHFKWHWTCAIKPRQIISA